MSQIQGNKKKKDRLLVQAGYKMMPTVNKVTNVVLDKIRRS